MNKDREPLSRDLLYAEHERVMRGIAKGETAREHIGNALAILVGVRALLATKFSTPLDAQEVNKDIRAVEDRLRRALTEIDRGNL